MEAGGSVADCVSPESTVTSLLSSSGHLRSGLLAREHDATFAYREQVGRAPPGRPTLTTRSQMVNTSRLQPDTVDASSAQEMVILHLEGGVSD